MGSRRLDLRSRFETFDHSVDRLQQAAFGPSPSLYRLISLCGWRPFFDDRLHTDVVCRRRPSTIDKAAGIRIHETSDGITIEVALSSVKEESLHVAITGKMVIIRGERIVTAQTRPHDIGRRENTLFRHTIQLPATVNGGGFRAQLVNDTVKIKFGKRR